MALEGTPKDPNSIVCNEQNVITADVTSVDGCPALPKLKAHSMSRGQAATLEWVFRNKQGDPIDLDTCGCVSSESSSTVSEGSSDSAEPSCGLVMRVREVMGDSCTPIYEQAGTLVDGPNGVVRANVPEELAKIPGIYQEEWAVISNDQIIVTNRGLLFVERGLFGLDDTYRDGGPPTLGEIRLALRDSSPVENLLLDALEFDDAEIMFAIIRPVQEFVERPPPLNLGLVNTQTFPYREHWLKAITGYLLQSAAHHYRRNQLDYAATGMRVDDKNKEPPYIRAAQALLQEWHEFITHKKVSINAGRASGRLGSSYGSYY